MSSNPEDMTKRDFVLGGAALGASLVAPDALAQNYGAEFDHSLHQITDKAGAADFEKRQAREYRADPNVIFKGERISEFYGIKRSEIEVLPGHHPWPDIYRDLIYKDAAGLTQSCCHGEDCRPAIIRSIGNGSVAVGLKMFDSILFFKLQLADTRIFSNGTLLPGSEEFLKHKSHACVVGGTIRCVVLPADG